MDGVIAALDLGPCGSMHTQPVPHDEDRVAELTPELTKEAQQVVGDDVLFGQEAKIKSHLAFLGRDGNSCDHRDALMGTCPLIEDGGLSNRRPCATQEGSHEEAALIEKDKSGFQSPGVFFTRGHWSRTQLRIATSSRSRARRSGFWGLKPRERRRRLMWLA